LDKPDKGTSNFLNFIEASIEAIDKLSPNEYQIEFKCPICGGQAVVHARDKRGIKTLAGGGCKNCGMSMMV
jgi:predicted RNA-binding Zn-ribbon protein involved in translation (DUF1610 family)